MSNKKGGYPIHPHQGSGSGITLRQYFAGLAMQGYNACDTEMVLHSTDKAKWAVVDADALLEALDE